MKAILNTARGELKWAELPKPEPGPGQVRIRTSVCGICSTDLELIDGRMLRGQYPRILGHEWSGIVDACGPGADPSLPGKPCVAENVLQDGGEVGFEHPGGYGEFFITQADKIMVLPEDFDMETGALIEPLAVAVRGMQRMNPSTGPALILGDGPIGLLMLMLMKRRGVKDITVVGGREARLNLARALGAKETINYHDAGVPLADYLATRGAMPFSSLVDAAKSAAAIPIASLCGAHGAKILLIGNYVDVKASVVPQEFLHKEFVLLGSNASAGAWPDAVRLAVEGAIPLRKIVGRVHKVRDFARAIDEARNDRGAMKILLQWH